MPYNNILELFGVANNLALMNKFIEEYDNCMTENTSKDVDTFSNLMKYIKSKKFLTEFTINELSKLYQDLECVDIEPGKVASFYDDTGKNNTKLDYAVFIDNPIILGKIINYIACFSTVVKYEINEINEIKLQKISSALDEYETYIKSLEAMQCVTYNLNHHHKSDETVETNIPLLDQKKLVLTKLKNIIDNSNDTHKTLLEIKTLMPSLSEEANAPDTKWEKFLQTIQQILNPILNVLGTSVWKSRLHKIEEEVHDVDDSDRVESTDSVVCDPMVC